MVFAGSGGEAQRLDAGRRRKDCRPLAEEAQGLVARRSGAKTDWARALLLVVLDGGDRALVLRQLGRRESNRRGQECRGLVGSCGDGDEGSRPAEELQGHGRESNSEK